MSRWRSRRPGARSGSPAESVDQTPPQPDRPLRRRHPQEPRPPNQRRGRHDHHDDQRHLLGEVRRAEHAPYARRLGVVLLDQSTARGVPCTLRPRAAAAPDRLGGSRATRSCVTRPRHGLASTWPQRGGSPMRLGCVRLPSGPAQLGADTSSPTDRAASACRSSYVTTSSAPQRSAAATCSASRLRSAEPGSRPAIR